MLADKAEASRQLFNAGIKDVLENLKKKVLDMNDMDDKVAQILPKSLEVTDQADLGPGFNPVLAELGFP